MLRTALVAVLCLWAAAAAAAADGDGPTLPAAQVQWIDRPPPGPTCWFRQTGGCRATGSREPAGDRRCDETVPCSPGNCPSGYCECGDGTKVHPVPCLPGTHQPFQCVDQCRGHNPPPANASGKVLALSNGYVRAVLDPASGQLLSLSGDFSGGANFSANALATPWALETVGTDGTVVRSAVAGPLTVLHNSSAVVSVHLAGIADAATAAAATEAWTLTLRQGSRGVELNVTGSVGGAAARPIASARHGAAFAALSVYGLYDRGVVQMKGDTARYFGSTDRLGTLYALGGGTAVELLRQTAAIGQQTVMASGPPGAAPGSGFADVWAGTMAAQDEWGSADFGHAAVPAGTAWTASTLIAPNNRNFPSLNLTVGPNLPEADLEAYMTGAYGSSPGCLCTYDNEVVKGLRVAQIATTIARPDRGYSGTYNYFDPDNFISLSAMLYSGNPYLQHQAQMVLERSGAFLRPNGQLPHHFVNDKPTYLALSGATQTGPNTFWTKTALQYAKATGDLDWLRGYMPTLRHSSSFCFDLIDPRSHMLNAPGSLMIDVFIRNNFTADSNAMMSGFLREFAEAEDLVGNVTGAARLRALAEAMSLAMNSRLWASPGVGLGGDDHYVTQLNPDNTTRDFVDYDSNLIAVAHAVPSPARAAKVLARVDQGRCSAASGGGPQFVSERYYGKGDTTQGNTGDSWCSMGRIAWFDSHARKYVGDAAALTSFNNLTLWPLQRDLIADTWMHERYGCDGKQQENRTVDYFEYPSTVVMMLREIRYGINLGITNVTINPFGPKQYNFHIGNVDVDYSAAKVVLSLPGTGTRLFTVTGLTPKTMYSVASCHGASSSSYTDPSGVLAFSADIGCTITVAA